MMKYNWTTLEGILSAQLDLKKLSLSYKKLLIFILLSLFFGCVYGSVMGSYGGIDSIQIIYSGVKVPMLFICSFFLSLPSFFVLSTLLGLRQDFLYAIGALLVCQSGVTIILCSFMPFTVLWYTSFSDYKGVIIFNGLMFALASISAQFILRKFYRPLIAKNKRHLWLLRAWFAIYSFVAIQMSWTLRPFIGYKKLDPQFFRDEAWGNAYIELTNIIINYVIDKLLK